MKPIKRLRKQVINDWEIELMQKYYDKMPSGSLYAALLFLAEHAFGITNNEARNNYGLYTNEQWIKLLNL